MPFSTPERLLIAIAGVSSVLAAGCATISARGMVRDASGAPVRRATLVVTSEEGARPIAFSSTDENGCFNVSRVAPPHERRFVIEAAGNGLKPASFRFSLQAPILLAVLVGASAHESSLFRSMTLAERSTLWEPICVPPIPREASSLGPS